MRISPKARMNRMFTNGGCLDVAIDHGVCNEPGFLVGLEDMPAVVDTLIAAKPDAIQMTYGQADLLQSRPEKDKPALVMRIDMGNPITTNAIGSCGRCCKTTKTRSSERWRWTRRV